MTFARSPSPLIRSSGRAVSTFIPLITPQSSFSSIGGFPSFPPDIFRPHAAAPSAVVVTPPLTMMARQHVPLATTAIAASKTGGFMAALGHFFQFLFVFTLGGLFFSTAVAGVTAVAALGKENLSRVWSIVKLVLGRVWNVFRAGLKEARLALRMDGKWKWREGWKVLKASLLETRKVAAEGVQAIKAEANFYFAAVGVPGLLPLQYVIDHLMPYSLATQLEDAFRDTVKNVKNPNIRKLSLTEFSAGTKAPELLSARIYDLGENAMGFDVDVKWESQLVAKIKLNTRRMGIPVPVTVQNIQFQGVVRCALVPLISDPPGFGAVLLSFPDVPKIGLDVRVAGSEITKVPWLRSELLKEIRKSIEEELLWPKRTVVPMKTPSGRLLLSTRALEELEEADPLLLAENKLAEEKPMLKEHMESMKPDKRRLSRLLDVNVRE